MVNKKASTMLRFLTILLITVLIFGFGSCVIAKFFRISEQAKENFAEFPNKIMEIQNSKVPTTDVFLLIMDKDTYVYFITKNTRGKLQVFNGKKYKLDVPKDCEKENCVCLCKENNEKDDTISCNTEKKDTLVCKKLPGIKITSDSEAVMHRFDDDSRRQPLRIIKCNGGEAYCKSSQKGDISMIFDSLDDKGYYDHLK